MKKFLVQIEDSPQTRWLTNDSGLMLNIQANAQCLSSLYTEGTVPRVTVTPEEQPVPINIEG